MTADHLADGVVASISQLIPNTRVTCVAPMPPGTSPSGFERTSQANALLWLMPRNGQAPVGVLVEREEVGLTATELALLELVPSSIDELAANGSQSLLGLGLRFSNRIGFGDLLIARFLDPGRAESWNNTMGLFSSFHRLPLFSF